MKRSIITIDQEKCTGCAACIPGCPEGAIQIIDGKARLISDLFCDGLGACIGHCPENAITIEEREAAPYDERLVMENIIPQGLNTIRAHIKHLKDHHQVDFYRIALQTLTEKGIQVDESTQVGNNMLESNSPLESTPGEPPHSHAGHHAAHHAQPVHHVQHAHQAGHSCPGSQAVQFQKSASVLEESTGSQASALSHWPIQLHLINPSSPHFHKSDLLVAADCSAFTLGSFHQDYLKNKTLVIACPKLDHGLEIYLEKLKNLIDVAEVNTIHVMIMRVPCCHGLLDMVQQAAQSANRKVPIKSTIVGIEGNILQESWV